jgi:hypothetical protein
MGCVHERVSLFDMFAYARVHSQIVVFMTVQYMLPETNIYGLGSVYGDNYIWFGIC